MKRFIYALTLLVIFTTPIAAQAGVRDLLGSAWSHLVHAVKAGAIGADLSSDAPADEDADDPAADDEASVAPTDAASAQDAGMCRVPQQQPEHVCEPGAGFVCINSPTPGVAEDHAVIRGTIDRGNSIMADISATVQHEYTKESVSIDTSAPLRGDCWKQPLLDRPFCIDERGFFSMRVPLDRLGPHTIAVSVSRMDASPMLKQVRLSRVIAPVFTDDSLEFDPDVRVNPAMDGSMLNVIVNLLGDCQFCDFIGASTGAVKLTVENTISSTSGAVRYVSCSTTVEQGGQGRFVVGVPVGEGRNVLAVSVCNAAVEDACPRIEGIVVTAQGQAGSFEFITPEPLPAYDARLFPTLDWSFRIGGLAQDDCVTMRFNRESARRLCATSGVFRTELTPRVGINVATVETSVAAGVRVYPWTFGWGRIVSPFEDGIDYSHGGIQAHRALQLAIPARTMTDIVQPLVSNFFSSRGFGRFVSNVMGAAPDPRTPLPDEPSAAALDAKKAIDAIKDEIEGCGGGSSMMDGKRIEVVGVPQIGAVDVEGMTFEDDRISFTVRAADVEARIRLVTDEDGDGVPDGDPLPLLIAFRRAYLDFELTQIVGGGGRQLFMIGSPHTDCDYKSRRYCRGTAAPLIPRNFIGSATATRGFVRCDAQGQAISKKTRELCDAMNALNAQTGVVSEKVLDAINGTLSCTGSAAITHMLRGGSSGEPMRIGCFPDDPEDSRGPLLGCASGSIGKLIGPWLVSFGIDLGEGLKISRDGILATASLYTGSHALFASIPDEMHHPSVGVIEDPAPARKLPIRAVREQMLAQFAFSTDALNHALFLLTHQSYNGVPGGLIDMDISEVFFKRLGFDFAQQCDAFNVETGSDAKPSPLCNIRPRVAELLGTSLTTYRFLDANQPVMMRLRANRALAPVVRVVGLEDVPPVSYGEDMLDGDVEVPEGNLVELQLGGVRLSFYALETDASIPLDEFGNPALKLDSRGEPIIRPMRPSVADPDRQQIISFDLTLLVALEFGDVMSDPDDPTRFIIKMRPLADRTRLVLTAVDGSNATTVPSEALVPSLREKLSYAISIFSAREKAVGLPLPKIITLAPATPSSDSLMQLMGLNALVLGPDGLSLTWFGDSSYVMVDLKGSVRQVFERDGSMHDVLLP